MKPSFPPLHYGTAHGIEVIRTEALVPYEGAADPLLNSIESQLGVLLSSSYEIPGRYSRWDIGFSRPPLQISSKGREVTISALNSRGAVLLDPIEKSLRTLLVLRCLDLGKDSSGRGVIRLEIKSSTERFSEEARSKQPSVFSVLRAIVQLFSSPSDSALGLYGAFGYDLAFQFEPIAKRIERDSSQRDLVLFLPDEILVVDHYKREAKVLSYEFSCNGKSTTGLERDGGAEPFVPATSREKRRDYAPGEYAALVSVAKDAFKRGDLFEVVPCQSFFEPSVCTPAELFRRIRERNPAPYGFLMNLGEQEYLIGASPEMYVRVTDRRVETCPISGTIARGRDAISDAEQILKLLNSEKDLSELTMCTDVDRNDKSRICDPGSIRIIGRRQIEMYSRVIHTVDHVEGTLRPEYDALDAFLSHAWAVTVTGAPKRWAMQFIENNEKSPREWYGGAVGVLGFDGNLNTGLVLRTVHLKRGVAKVSAGATLLYDSIPEEEEAETEMKASAFLDAVREVSSAKAEPKLPWEDKPGAGKTVLLVDHEDSFVHMLGGYFRQTGAEVVTVRCGFEEELLEKLEPDLVVLSPGPGTPKDFKMAETIGMVLRAKLPIFGVCLGLQGVVEYYGGELGVLDYPMHGKSSKIVVKGGRVFAGLPQEIEVGRYHSLYALKKAFPASLVVTAETGDGVIMAIEHESLPIAAVQFHPESIMTLSGNFGMRIITNVVRALAPSGLER